MATRKWLWTLGLSLVLLAGQSSLVLAQRGGGGMRGGAGGGMFGRMGGGPTDVALRDDVRKELGLSESQVQGLEEVNEKLQQQRQERAAAMRDRFQQLRDMSDDERQELMQSLQKEQLTQQKEVRAQVAKVLNRDQMKRLGQLEFQYYLQRGGVEQALTAAGVDLSEADREKMMAARQEIQQRVQQQIAELQRKAQEEILATVLNSGKVKELSGDAFEFASQRPMDPGARFGGNRPGRGNRDARPGPARTETEEPSGGNSRRSRR